MALKHPAWCCKVFSDSRCALGTTGTHRADSLHPMAVEAGEKIAKLRNRGGALALYWTKAHVRVDGNERADHLAKEAAL